MKRSEVERVAEEMARVHDPGWTTWAKKHDAFDSWHKIARWHLREVRKARGRTVGWTAVDDKRMCCIEFHPKKDVEEFVENGGYRTARVVVDSKPKRRRKP